MPTLIHIHPRSAGTLALLGSRPSTVTGASALPGTTPMPGGPLGLFLGPDDVRAFQADLAARADAVDNAIRSNPKASSRLAAWASAKTLVDRFTNQKPASFWDAGTTLFNKLIWRDGQAAEKALVRWENEAKAYGYSDPFEPDRKKPGFDWTRWFPYMLSASAAVLLLASGGYFVRGLPLRAVVKGT
jgi:hypothetical protein